MKIIKILLFILTIIISWSISYYSYLFIAPIGAVIGGFYEGMVQSDQVLDAAGAKGSEILYKTKLGFAQTKAIITNDGTQIQKLQNDRTNQLEKKELERLANLEHIQMVQKSISVFPYLLSGLIGLITFFFLSSKLFQFKSYLISAKLYFSDTQES